MSEEEIKNNANNILGFRQIGLIEATDTLFDTIQEMLNLIDKLQKENQELKEKNTILEGNKIGYKLAIQELKEKIKEYEIGMLKE